MRRLIFGAPIAALVLAGCATTAPDGGNAGAEQLRAQLTRAMRDAGLSETCIQSLSFSALAEIKSVASSGFGPRDNVGLGNARSREIGRIRAIAGRECEDL